ncbi:hypothetical protein KW429_11075 [Vibrio fluvialis]|nr:hypothetical protein [Vibrio fluvialis]MBY7902394.1 hypothetical protein [Vibrio fluvialis]
MARRAQRGMTMVGILLAMVVFTTMVTVLAQIAAEARLSDAIDLQGQRLANIANAVLRYQSSAENPTATPPILAPKDQHNIAGAAFMDGAIYSDLKWLKPTSCGGSSPIELIGCTYPEFPVLSDDGIYHFTVENDGAHVYTTIRLVQKNDHSQGMVIRGQLDDVVAREIALKAESLISFTSAGAASTYFTVEAGGIIAAKIGIDVTNNPYLRKDGDTATGTISMTNGAGIQGASNVSSLRFSGYDAATNTESTTRYLDPLGESFLENLDVVGLTSDTFDTKIANIDTLTAAKGTVRELDTEYINQTNSNVQNRIAGELKIGQGADDTVINNGDIYTSGVLASRDNPNYFVKPDSVSVMEDIALLSMGGAKLSDLTRYVLIGTAVVSHGQTIDKPSCGTATPKILLSPRRWTTNFLKTNGQPAAKNNINYLYAEDYATYWRPRWLTHDMDSSTFALMDDVNGMAMAQIYCRFN